MTSSAGILPDTPENRELAVNVHPTDWINPPPDGLYNLVVVGAGTAGLVCAAGAAGLGARVALIERHLLGAIAKTMHPYPTQAEVVKKLADLYNRTRLTPFVRGALTGWLKWHRG